MKPNPYCCLRMSVGLKFAGRSYFAGWYGLFTGGREVKRSCLRAGLAGIVASMTCDVCLLCCIEINPSSVFGIVAFNSINTTV